MKQFALLGAGFWAANQLAAWQEVPGAVCVAICDPVEERAEALAGRFGVARVHTDPRAALGDVDFWDVVTPPATHPELVRLAVEAGLPVISQKPVAETLEEVEALLALGGSVFVHENWRWQAPIRELSTVLQSGVIGEVFRARLRMVSGFDLYKNQPGLKRLARFVLADIGVHVLDTARFLFGEAQSLVCHTGRLLPDVAGEDVATVLTRHGGVSVTTELGYVRNYYEQDRFPETFLLVEGSKGSIELAPDYWLRVTTAGGTHARRIVPPRYPWADPAYDVIHAAMVPCLTDLLRGVSGGGAETTLVDNYQTMRLVEAAYQSAASGETVHL